MSSEVQIAVIDQQDTQIVLAVPGVQGATGSPISAGGTANQVLRKASSTNYDTDWSLVTNAMVDSSAAIAGTKISPNFGSQNVVTTGTSTAASFIPTSSSVPTNGVYLPSANNVAISTNGTGKLIVDADGNIGIGSLSFGTYSDRSLSLYATTNPSYKLCNATTGTTRDDGIDIILAGSDGYLWNRENAAWIFGTNNDERMRLTSTGALGLGTSSPSYKLDVSGDFRNSGIYFNQNDTPQGTAGTITKHSVVGLTTRGVTASVFDWSVYSAAGNALISNATGTDNISFPGGNVVFTGGSVGIGTSSPSSLLHLNAASGSVQTQYNNGGTSTYIGIDSGFTGCDIAAGGGIRFRYFSGGSYQNGMVLDTSGRLGIGSSSPLYKLQIEGSSSTVYSGSARNTLLGVYNPDTTSGAYAGIELQVAGAGNASLANISAIDAGSGSTDVAIGVRNSNTFEEKVRIKSSGAVGIGNTAPSANLHVSNTGGVPSAVNVGRFSNDGARLDITVTSAASGDALIDLSAFSAGSGNSSSAALSFSTRNAGALGERARIDSSGRLLVGTSTSRAVSDSSGNGPQGRIQIEAANSDALMSIISAGTADAFRAGTLSLGRHRNSTVGGTPTVVQSGDTLGAICFAGGFCRRSDWLWRHARALSVLRYTRWPVITYRSRANW
jgi:hypothetical protein